MERPNAQILFFASEFESPDGCGWIQRVAPENSISGHILTRRNDEEGKGKYVIPNAHKICLVSIGEIYIYIYFSYQFKAESQLHAVS